jgi:hypothetical protein
MSHPALTADAVAVITVEPPTKGTGAPRVADEQVPRKPGAYFLEYRNGRRHSPGIGILFATLPRRYACSRRESLDRTGSPRRSVTSIIARTSMSPGVGRGLRPKGGRRWVFRVQR